MTQIRVSDDLGDRVAQFKKVVEAVLEQKISFDNCMALVIGQGIDSMLADILGHVDPTTMLTSFQQLGSRYPAEVYAYVAEVLRKGAAAKERERLRKKLGFYKPSPRRRKT